MPEGVGWGWGGRRVENDGTLFRLLCGVHPPFYFSPFPPKVHQQKQDNSPSPNNHVSSHDEAQVYQASTMDPKAPKAGTPHRAPAGIEPEHEHAEMASKNNIMSHGSSQKRVAASTLMSNPASEGERQPAAAHKDAHEPPSESEQTNPVKKEGAEISCKVDRPAHPRLPPPPPPPPPLPPPLLTIHPRLLAAVSPYTHGRRRRRRRRPFHHRYSGCAHDPGLSSVHGFDTESVHPSATGGLGPAPRLTTLNLCSFAQDLMGCPEHDCTGGDDELAAVSFLLVVFGDQAVFGLDGRTGNPQNWWDQFPQESQHCMHFTPWRLVNSTC